MLRPILLVVLLPSLAAAEDAWPMPDWPRARPAEVQLDETRLKEARDYALSGEGSGFITRGGKLVMSWGDPKQRYDLKSSTKSIGVTALGLAILDGKMRLDDKAAQHHPAFGTPPESNRKTGWLGEITLRHLAAQTAGFEKPGGYMGLLFRPGTKWHYSDGGPNWLAECVTLAYRRDVSELMFERVFTPIGIEPADLVWRNNSYRPKEIDGIPRREFGAGVSANVDAMARLGLLYLRRGQWQGKRLLPEEFIDAARKPLDGVVGLPEHDPQHGNASDHYGLLWWNNADGTIPGLPRDAYWSWGLYDSLIVVVPSLDIVVSRAGKSWKRQRDEHYDVLRPFLEPIAAAAESNKRAAVSPEQAFPPSPIIKDIAWAPASTIVRLAKGSDNWPTTWGEGNVQYTAYGDGWGFDPRVEKKLSLGLAKIIGGTEDFRAENLRAATLETLGDGASGKKASGILMVDGVLYLLVRNASNAQFAWSKDQGATWTWCDWRFDVSFGCPTLLNFGPDYRGARDQYVYIYSPDTHTAYRPADRMILARVPKDRILDRNAYEFYTQTDEGRPQWTRDIDRRGAVLAWPGRCGRSIVSYNEPLKRYLWVQVLPGDAKRRGGGLAIFDAAEPWGPWTLAHRAEPWDVDPGETAGFPTAWIGPDGRTPSLVFSGDDSFAVRRATLTVAGP